VDRLNGVVSRFLDYSRPLKPSLAPTSVNEVLERTFKLLQAEVPPGVGVELQLAEWLPHVAADAEGLKQVFLNLALNAFQAMPGGGRLVVSTRLARDELAFWREGARKLDVVEVRFRDSGAGIPDEARERIFVPFYTTKEKGTGLGLAICQRIVKAHQGTIQAHSAPGEGAEFLVSLPGLREERPAGAPKPPLDDDEKARARERRRTRAEARLRKRKKKRRQQA
jgi:signal transduction histidine kinase